MQFPVKHCSEAFPRLLPAGKVLAGWSSGAPSWPRYTATVGNQAPHLPQLAESPGSAASMATQPRRCDLRVLALYLDSFGAVRALN